MLWVEIFSDCDVFGNDRDAFNIELKVEFKVEASEKLLAMVLLLGPTLSAAEEPMLTISSSSVIPLININRAKRATHTSGLTAAAPRSTNHGRWGTSMGALIFITFFALCRQGGRTVPVRSVVPRVVPFFSLVLVCGPIPLPPHRSSPSLSSRAACCCCCCCRCCCS